MLPMQNHAFLVFIDLIWSRLFYVIFQITIVVSEEKHLFNKRANFTFHVKNIICEKNLFGNKTKNASFNPDNIGPSFFNVGIGVHLKFKDNQNHTFPHH